MDDAQKALQFVTISSDGCINIWTLNKSELTHEFLMKLRKDGGEGPPVCPDKAGADGKSADGEKKAEVEAGEGGMSAGCCMDFNKGPGQDHIYLVRGRGLGGQASADVGCSGSCACKCCLVRHCLPAGPCRWARRRG